MRFLLYPLRRAGPPISTTSAAGKRATDKKATILTPQTSTSPSTVVSSSASAVKAENPPSKYQASDGDSASASNNLTKSWGQQCSRACGCVLRFEASVDVDTKRIVHAAYVAKSVVTTIDTETGRLEPVYTTRTHRPMLQICTCPSLHTLARHVTSYLPDKRVDQIQNMNQFTLPRSSAAFRHAVLAEHNLPRSNTHCFDVLEEAFCGVIEGTIPARRRLNAEFGTLLTAECLERPVLVVHRHEPKPRQQYSEHHGGRRDATRRGAQGRSSGVLIGRNGIGIDNNKLAMTTPRTASTLRMFDINAEYWEEEEYAEKVASRKSNGTRLDWVAYIDEMYENEESA
jgi:hypothetical protein